MCKNWTIQDREIPHKKHMNEINLFLSERFDHLRESEFISLRDALLDEVIHMLTDLRQQDDKITELLPMVKIEKIIAAAGLDVEILNIWACPKGCDIDVVLVCGGPWGDDPNGKNRYFQAKLNGAYTSFDEHGIPGVPDDCFAHADDGCCNEPVCPDCGENCVSGPVMEVSFCSIWDGDAVSQRAKFLPATGKVYDVPTGVELEGNSTIEFIGLPDGSVLDIEIKDGQYFVVNNSNSN